MDPDPGGPKTCGSGGSGFRSGSTTGLLSVKSNISSAYRREEDREESLESPAKRMRLSAEEEAGPCDSADGATPLQVRDVTPLRGIGVLHLSVVDPDTDLFIYTIFRINVYPTLLSGWRSLDLKLLAGSGYGSGQNHSGSEMNMK